MISELTRVTFLRIAPGLTEHDSSVHIILLLKYAKDLPMDKRFFIVGNGSLDYEMFYTLIERLF